MCFVRDPWQPVDVDAGAARPEPQSYCFGAFRPAYLLRGDALPVEAEKPADGCTKLGIESGLFSMSRISCFERR